MLVKIPLKRSNQPMRSNDTNYSAVLPCGVPNVLIHDSGQKGEHATTTRLAQQGPRSYLCQSFVGRRIDSTMTCRVDKSLKDSNTPILSIAMWMRNGRISWWQYPERFSEGRVGGQNEYARQDRTVANYTTGERYPLPGRRDSGL